MGKKRPITEAWYKARITELEDANEACETSRNGFYDLFKATETERDKLKKDFLASVNGITNANATIQELRGHIDELKNCEHENTVGGELKGMCVFELCLDCGRSRAVYECDASDWMANTGASKNIARQFRKIQTDLDEMKRDGITAKTQDRIRDLVVRESGADQTMIDGGGCDSGDPVDFTLDEIAQGFNYISDEVIEPLKAKIKELRTVLIAHRADLHQGSSRPCGTCRDSAKALGIIVPDRCAQSHTDKAALEKLNDRSG